MSVREKVVYLAICNSFGEVFIVEILKPDPKKQYYQKYNLVFSEVKNNDPNETCNILLKDLNLFGELIFIGEKEFDSNGRKVCGYFFLFKEDIDIDIKQDYIEKGEFVSKEIIENMILQDPDIFSPEFLVFWNNFKERILS